MWGVQSRAAAMRVALVVATRRLSSPAGEICGDSGDLGRSGERCFSLLAPAAGAGERLSREETLQVMSHFKHVDSPDALNRRDTPPRPISPHISPHLPASPPISPTGSSSPCSATSSACLPSVPTRSSASSSAPSCVPELWAKVLVWPWPAQEFPPSAKNPQDLLELRHLAEDMRRQRGGRT